MKSVPTPTDNNRIPVAVVVAADDVTLTVRCPACLDEVHHHGTGGGLGLRTVHCDGGPPLVDYLVVDPAGLLGGDAA